MHCNYDIFMTNFYCSVFIICSVRFLYSIILFGVIICFTVLLMPLLLDISIIASVLLTGINVFAFRNFICFLGKIKFHDGHDVCCAVACDSTNHMIMCPGVNLSLYSKWSFSTSVCFFVELQFMVTREKKYAEI